MASCAAECSFSVALNLPELTDVVGWAKLEPYAIVTLLLARKDKAVRWAEMALVANFPCLTVTGKACIPDNERSVAHWYNGNTMLILQILQLFRIN